MSKTHYKKEKKIIITQERELTTDFTDNKRIIRNDYE